MGFPCQPSSRAGDQKGTQDERAMLCRCLPELHAILRPWGWILENVANAGQAMCLPASQGL
eukprot:2032671-Prorocentrum_lima.AAC.1